MPEAGKLSYKGGNISLYGLPHFGTVSIEGHGETVTDVTDDAGMLTGDGAGSISDGSFFFQLCELFGDK